MTTARNGRAKGPTWSNGNGNGNGDGILNVGLGIMGGTILVGDDGVASDVSGSISNNVCGS